MLVLLNHLRLSFFIYNITIVINTFTTMNNQFQALNAPKINIYIFILLFFTHKNHFLFTSFLFHPKIPSFYLKILSLFELLKFMILGQEQVNNFH